MSNKLLGLHHVTAMTSDAVSNFKFFTEVLGMRLVKKTVNQDDIQTYHTFFADDGGNAGTDITFFDFPNQPKGQKGTNSLYRTSLRVPSDEALEYYKKRFEEFDVKHEDISEFNGHKILRFEDEDGQLLQLISDEHNEGVEGGIPWKNGPVPEEYAIYGLGPIEIRVTYFEEMIELLKRVYEMREVKREDDYVIMEMGEGGNGAQVYLFHDEDSPQAMQGYGDIHHVSFRVKDEEAIESWVDRYAQFNIGNSGIIDRFYFKALYARIGHVLFEISTDGPGFDTDEPYETMGESLSLPPFLESRREYVESVIRPFDTSRSHKE